MLLLPSFEWEIMENRRLLGDGSWHHRPKNTDLKGFPPLLPHTLPSNISCIYLDCVCVSGFMMWCGGVGYEGELFEQNKESPLPILARLPPAAQARYGFTKGLRGHIRLPKAACQENVVIEKADTHDSNRPEEDKKEERKK